MMLRLESKRVRFAASFIVVSLTLFLCWPIVKAWLAHEGLSRPPSREKLLRAVSFDTRNSSYHYSLGLYLHYEPPERDLRLSLNSYINAIHLNPVRAEYWLELAKVYYDLNDLAASSKALDRARELGPTNLKTHWMMVNLELRKGETERALGVLKLVLKDHPDERTKAFKLLHLITGNDVELIIDKAVPKEVGTMTEYLSFLMGSGDTEGVKALWKTLSRGFELDPKVRIRYVDYLISRGEMEGARGEWVRYKGIGNEPASLVWNSGFEKDIDNGGFGWRIGRVEGVDVNLDDSVSFKGNRSLRIEFDGRHNVLFYHVHQIIPLLPQTSYTLSANVMTDGITTDKGIFIRFYGINGCSFSGKTEVLTGTNEWRELRIELKTPPGCNAGAVRVRRTKSEKFNNLINGRVWIDGVRLERSHGGAS